MAMKNRLAWIGFALGLLAPSVAYANKPMQYLNGYGTKAYQVVGLTWLLLAISILVIIIVSVLVIVGVLTRKSPGNVPIAAVKVERAGNGLRWVIMGVAVSLLVLFGSAVWSMMTLAAVNGPSRPSHLTIVVTGQQWWWSARYLSNDTSRVFTTADEIHIPVGRPVQIHLISTDVMHGFWVPLLSGQTYAIPGQTNRIWIEADKPGRYRGECKLFCGVQHANMLFYIVAQPPAQFQTWWDNQLKPAPAPTTKTTIEGAHLFIARCGVCHTVRGTGAGGILGPDLTHLASRKTILGALPNTPGNLSGWVANPQAIMPGNKMPIPYLSGPELHDITSYLETLR
ncbi:MAG: cytochrome c oxidase subunit II [Acetobacteraceae bacterium]